MFVESSSIQTGSRIDPDRLRIVLRRLDHSNPLMVVTMKVIEAVHRACGPEELASIIAGSPELSMRVVRVANAAAFGNRHCESVRHAIELLGWDRIASIAMTVRMAEEAKTSFAETCWNPAAYQRRSITLALLAQFLAKRVDPFHAEKYYLIGLFQEWGYLVIAQYAPNRMRPIAMALEKADSKSPTELEDFYCGSNHAVLGSIAAEEYEMSSELIASIRYHHEPDEAPDEYQVAANVAHLASFVAGELGSSIFPGAKNHPLDPASLLFLGWNWEEIESIKGIVSVAAESVHEELDGE